VLVIEIGVAGVPPTVIVIGLEISLGNPVPTIVTVVPPSGVP
jgi:hypothetical protein